MIGWPQCRKISTVDTVGGSGALFGAGPYGPEVNADKWSHNEWKDIYSELIVRVSQIRGLCSQV